MMRHELHSRLGLELGILVDNGVDCSRLQKSASRGSKLMSYYGRRRAAAESSKRGSNGAAAR
jgi:hypothetical protein